MKKTIRLASLALALLFAALPLAACRNGNEDEKAWTYERSADLPDYATAVTLNTAGLDSDFNETGRGYVKLDHAVDGDTAHFWNNSHTELLKVRFIAIDTPESTGKVEPWGKPASIYTRKKLQNADKIVLESDIEGSANFDSTGSRYLAWVWYKNKGSDVWRNLNIEILADGLAMGKSASSNRYGSTAAEALTSARNEKLNLYSGRQDPLFYYGEAVELSIKSLVLNRESYSGIKVRFEGVVTKKSGEGIYMQAFDDDTQQYYGVYVYGGYASLAPKFLVPGYRLSVTGTADNNETFGFQVSGLSFSLINPTGDDVKILEKDVVTEPRVVDAQTLNGDATLENTLVRIEGIRVASVYTTVNESSSSKGAMTLTCLAPDGSAVTVRTAVLTDESGETVTESRFASKTVSVTGIVEYYEGSAQLKLLTLADCDFAD
jgi:micrococcal nuclease